jgi:hypothetical protein
LVALRGSKKQRQDFQAFTITFTGRANRVVTDLRISEAFDPANPPNPLPDFVSTKALWDTGATGSMISAGLAKSLKLAPTGITNINHAGGQGQSPTYIVNFMLPNHVGAAGVQVSQFPIPAGFDAIVGMDIIGMGDLALTNAGGKTVMSFRMPSIATIDYVKDARQIVASIAQRNDPCPCGSGKKYKKCHGAN